MARVATLFAGDDPVYWRDVLAREVAVARHLAAAGVPVIPPASDPDPGPHPVGDTWMTLWTYVPPVDRPSPDVAAAAALLRDLRAGLAGCPVPLPLLGAWRHGDAWVRTLQDPDHRSHHGSHGSDPWPAPLLHLAVDAWHRIDALLRALALEPRHLEPSHGDAHPGNLHPGPGGWLWFDFEDASLMPRHWDLASFVAGAYLLGKDPFFGHDPSFADQLVATVLGTPTDPGEPAAFALAVAARAGLSTITSASLAEQGHLDPDLARLRLERLPALLQKWMGWEVV